MRLLSAARSCFVALLIVSGGVEGFQNPAVARLSVIGNSRTTASGSQGIHVLSTANWKGTISQPNLLLKAKQHLTILAAAAGTTASATKGSVVYDDRCDILVLGSGPAARAIASLLAIDFDVLLADQRVDAEWPPNYGVWKDEWQSIVNRYSLNGVSLNTGISNEPHSVDREWPVTDCFFGGSFNIPVQERLRLNRPYCRIDRFSLRKALSPESENNAPYRILKANHISQATNLNLYDPPGSLLHDTEGTTIQLQTAATGEEKGNLLTVRTKLIIDCTGHETKLVLREPRDCTSRTPGFQIAYGALVEVDESTPSSNNKRGRNSIGPYDKEAMTLFDYRTDHFSKNDKDMQAKAKNAPTFMYAMPLKDNLIFFEETSLVARPAVSFQECKERCIRRLAHHDIRVKAVHEEEFCYIPMGGALPAKDQRVIGLGGAAVMVHPSTGYHLCRVLTGAADMADAIRKELKVAENVNLDRAAAAAYHALWSPENIRQRNFAVFGGEFLMKQTVIGLRGFFDGFFRLPVELWAGFLAGWPGLPNNENHESWYKRMWFGLTFVIKLPLPVALDMLYSIVEYTIREGYPLPQSVTPFLGAPASYEYKQNQDVVGDVAAKQEARKMIQASKITDDLPAAFNSAYGTTEISSTDLLTTGPDFELFTPPTPAAATKPAGESFFMGENMPVLGESTIVSEPVFVKPPKSDPDPAAWMREETMAEPAIAWDDANGEVKEDSLVGPKLDSVAKAEANAVTGANAQEVMTSDRAASDADPVKLVEKDPTAKIVEEATLEASPVSVDSTEEKKSVEKEPALSTEAKSQETIQPEPVSLDADRVPVTEGVVKPEPIPAREDVEAKTIEEKSAEKASTLVDSAKIVQEEVAAKELAPIPSFESASPSAHEGSKSPAAPEKEDPLQEKSTKSDPVATTDADEEVTKNEPSPESTANGVNSEATEVKPAAEVNEAEKPDTESSAATLTLEDWDATTNRRRKRGVPRSGGKGFGKKNDD